MTSERNHHRKYSLSVDRAAVELESACGRHFDVDDSAALMRYAIDIIDNPCEDWTEILPTTMDTVKDVIACMEAAREDVDWRAEYCRQHKALDEEWRPIKVAQSNHRSAIECREMNGHKNILDSLSESYENMRDTLRWAGYGTVTIEVAIDEWNRLELDRLTKLVNGDK